MLLIQSTFSLQLQRRFSLSRALLLSKTRHGKITDRQETPQIESERSMMKLGKAELFVLPLRLQVDQSMDNGRNGPQKHHLAEEEEEEEEEEDDDDDDDEDDNDDEDNDEIHVASAEEEKRGESRSCETCGGVCESSVQIDEADGSASYGEAAREL
jgi:hypothetical protein